MQIKRAWHMPNSKTFKIRPVRDLIIKYSKPNMTIVDPFANEHSIKDFLPGMTDYVSNDLDPQYDCNYCQEANEFLKNFKNASVDIVLYDPPYSPRQVKEVYTQLARTVTIQDTQASYWSNFKKGISRIVKPNGYVISCGWNSNGMGKVNGFEIVEVLLIAHGGSKNDTIVVVERKLHEGLEESECNH